MIKNIASNSIKIILSLLLGGIILFWMYKDFNFDRVKDVMLHEMNWTWMLLSFPFGILAQLFRGWRWQQTLEPLNEHARKNTLAASIFVSYAASLVIPRIGEFARCAILKRQDGVSFSSALGTVVTERIIDSLLVLTITGCTILVQVRVFDSFFNKTGTRIDDILASFSSTGYIITIACLVAMLIMIVVLARKLSVINKVKNTVNNIWKGITSLKSVRNKYLFLFFTLGIWASYFLHYYLTFFCFSSTAKLGLICALVTFVVGSIAVIVPTPNGAGPWHFAVKVMLILYGVAEADALYFVLIVHTIQTLLVIALGIYGWASLSFTKRLKTQTIK